VFQVLRRAGPSLRSLVVNNAPAAFTGDGLLSYAAHMDEAQARGGGPGGAASLPPADPRAPNPAFARLQTLDLSRCPGVTGRAVLTSFASIASTGSQRQSACSGWRSWGARWTRQGDYPEQTEIRVSSSRPKLCSSSRYGLCCRQDALACMRRHQASALAPVVENKHSIRSHHIGINVYTHRQGECSRILAHVLDARARFVGSMSAECLMVLMPLPQGRAGAARHICAASPRPAGSFLRGPL